MLPVSIIIFIALLAIAGILLLTGITVAREYERAVVFRLGRLVPSRGPGLFLIIPIIETKRMVDLRTVTVDVPPQDAITQDSVTVKVDAVLYYKIVDPVKSVIAVVNHRQAIDLASQTTLRSVIGKHDLAELLKNRAAINETLKGIIDSISDPWGIDVEMVDIKAVDIPEGMQRAMAKEAEATREKRARIIKAEAEQEAAAKLAEASRLISQNPMALELRRMQMISEVGAEQNTTTIIMMPSEFVTAAKSMSDHFSKLAKPTGS